MDNDIPKGYSLTVTTWEGDMDDFEHITKYGLSRDEVNFYIALLNEYNTTSFPNSYGISLTEDDGKDLFVKASAKFPVPESLNFEDDLPYEWVIFDFLPYFSIEGEDSYRVVDEIRVDYYPEAIIVKKDNVTSQFPSLKLRK